MFILFSVGELHINQRWLRRPQPVNSKGIRIMLKYYVKATDLLQRLRTDKDGVVSFEYIIVAVCIVTVVGLVFGGGANGAIGAALTTGITDITTAFATAVAGA